MIRVRACARATGGSHGARALATRRHHLQVRSKWFAIDVLSIAPSVIDILLAYNSDTDSKPVLQALRTVRAARLIKLIRLYKSSKVAAKLMEFVDLSGTTQTFISLALRTLLLCHWFACVLMIASTFAESPLETWLAPNGYCTGDESELLEHDVPLLSAPHEQPMGCVGVAFLYMRTFQTALGIVMAQGLSRLPDRGPFLPYYTAANVYRTPFLPAEECLLTCLKLIGIGYWALTMSKLMRAVVVLGNPAETAYQQDIDNVNRFCSYNRLPNSLARELRRFMHETQMVHKNVNRKRIYSKLSPLLVAKVTRQLYKPLFESKLIKRALSALPLEEGEKFVSAVVTVTRWPDKTAKPPASMIFWMTRGV